MPVPAYNPFGFDSIQFDVMRDSLHKRRERVQRAYDKAPASLQREGIGRELQAIDSLIDKFGLHYPKPLEPIFCGEHKDCNGHTDTCIPF